MRKVILQCFMTVLISVLVCFGVMVASIIFPIDSRKVLIDIKEEDVIGLTSLEVEEKYGKFDCISRSDGKGKDGLYRNTVCGYTKKERESVLYKEWPEWLFFIEFDENGIARIRNYSWSYGMMMAVRLLLILLETKVLLRLEKCIIKLMVHTWKPYVAALD